MSKLFRVYLRLFDLGTLVLSAKTTAENQVALIGAAPKTGNIDIENSRSKNISKQADEDKIWDKGWNNSTSTSHKVNSDFLL